MESITLEEGIATKQCQSMCEKFNHQEP